MLALGDTPNIFFSKESYDVILKEDLYTIKVFDVNHMFLWKKLIRKIIKDLNEEVPSEVKIYPVRHYLAHAASAYYF